MILQSFCWGFSVDDAWIVSRVAAHGSLDGAFAYNRGGPVTDAVTPWGYAHGIGYLGKALGASRPMEFWWVARLVGLMAYGASFFLAGFLIARNQKGWRRFAGSPLALLSVPAAVWAGAGLSAPVVGLLLLVGAAIVQGSARGREFGALLLGGAAAWRPELSPFVVIATLAFLIQKEASVGFFLRSLVLLGAPSILLMTCRFWTFGDGLPLSFSAKEPNLASGIRYALVTIFWAGLPWFVFSLRPLFRSRNLWAWAWVAHIVALVFAGGDWMPAMRLSAPLFPWLVWKLGSSLFLARGRRIGLAAIPAIPAMLGPLALLLSQGADYRAVADRRVQLVDQGRLALSRYQTVAAVDIGWVGLATAGRVVDLAGVTDPTIARLPGGHTSKAIYPGLFSDRNIDAWVIRASDRLYTTGEPLGRIHASYWVDARLLAKNADLDFVSVATIPLPGTRGQYIIAVRKGLSPALSD